MDGITDQQIAALIEWHAKDGTKKGELTVKALRELATWRIVGTISAATAIGRRA